MSSDFERGAEEPRDRTWLIWTAIVAVVVVMVVVLLSIGRPRPTTSLVQAKHILVRFDPGDPVERGQALQQIQELRERIMAGEKFEKFARDFSDDPGSAARGGDLGYVERDVFEEQIEQYVWTAEIGEVSPILQTRHGFHLVKVVDRFVHEADRYESDMMRRAAEQMEQTDSAEAEDSSEE